VVNPVAAVICGELPGHLRWPSGVDHAKQQRIGAVSINNNAAEVVFVP
jgi:hypothetical protein